MSLAITYRPLPGRCDRLSSSDRADVQSIPPTAPYLMCEAAGWSPQLCCISRQVRRSGSPKGVFLPQDPFSHSSVYTHTHKTTTLHIRRNTNTPQHLGALPPQASSRRRYYNSLLEPHWRPGGSEPWRSKPVLRASRDCFD